MSGYYNGFNACSDGIGNEENNAADGNLRAIASLDMGTYSNQYCDSRTFDMQVYVQSESTGKNSGCMRRPRNSIYRT
jgi:hypothetical protein